jgi:hypothetical protein
MANLRVTSYLEKSGSELDLHGATTGQRQTGMAQTSCCVPHALFTLAHHDVNRNQRNTNNTIWLFAFHNHLPFPSFPNPLRPAQQGLSSSPIDCPLSHACALGLVQGALLLPRQHLEPRSFRFPHPFDFSSLPLSRSVRRDSNFLRAVGDSHRRGQSIGPVLVANTTSQGAPCQPPFPGRPALSLTAQHRVYSFRASRLVEAT